MKKKNIFLQVLCGVVNRQWLIKWKQGYLQYLNCISWKKWRYKCLPSPVTCLFTEPCVWTCSHPVWFGGYQSVLWRSSSSPLFLRVTNDAYIHLIFTHKWEETGAHHRLSVLEQDTSRCGASSSACSFCLSLQPLLLPNPSTDHAGKWGHGPAAALSLAPLHPDLPPWCSCNSQKFLFSLTLSLGNGTPLVTLIPQSLLESTSVGVLNCCLAFPALWRSPLQ